MMQTRSLLPKAAPEAVPILVAPNVEPPSATPSATPSLARLARVVLANEAAAALSRFIEADRE